MKNAATVFVILLVWLLIITGYLGAFILWLPMLTFVLGSAFVIVFLTVWVMLPYWIYQQIIRLADLPLGPLRTGLNWWLAGTYYLMPMVTGLLVLLQGFTYFLDPTSLFPYFVVWIVAMLVALPLGYIGFRRWYRQQG